ncbi:hypothetical protein R70723_05935 [Paenibacillus sp. FSL R7-0273]|nr:hypothetical protein R70723_05935 [Paenibacillus sp. FSL R7-0273]OMF89141.1 hypothetical protein BK144_20250 [Paenibacillus sp. FSL R7-0273]
MVNAKSNQITAGRYWYTSAGEKIDSQYIVTNTIKTELMDKSAYVKEVKFPNSNIVTTYKIPIDDLDEDWLDVTETATMPITQHVEGRFYSAWVAYYYKATAKLTSYSYGGKVSFDYSPPTEPTLDGSVSVLKPSPNPAKFEGKDTAVSLKVKGDLLAYINSSNIEEWVFYAKETGSTDVKTKKDYNKVLTSTQAFDNFVISKSRGSNVKQEYTLTVTVRFSKPVVTGSGTISSLSKTMKATVEVSDAPVFSPPPVNNNKPPVAVLDVPGEVKAGSEFLMYGKDSYDPDGKIVKYYYSAPNTMEPVDGAFGFTWYPLTALGEHSVLLTVTDNGGLTGSTSAQINVIQPTPVAEIFVDGTKKENRKVTLVSRSRSPEHYPIDESKTQWTISAVSGGTAADIKYLGSLSGMNSKDVLFKKPGTYRATITVTNTAGFSHSTSTTFEIVPDEVPVVYISVPNKIYRDPGQGNMASAALTDMSFSPDFDFIGRRIWEYRYDSNNDGNFTDESWVIFSNENKSAFNLQLGKVGRYEIKLTVIEEFDQPTIEELVTQADRKSADSYTSVPQQPLSERVIEVYNRAPEVDWSW